MHLSASPSQSKTSSASPKSGMSQAASHGSSTFSGTLAP